MAPQQKARSCEDRAAKVTDFLLPPSFSMNFDPQGREKAG